MIESAILPDEPELGPQRQCSDCGQWWPDDDPDFWPVWSHWKSPRCRACHVEHRRAVERARMRASRAAAPRSTLRTRQRELRDRAAGLLSAGLPVPIVAATLRVHVRTVQKWVARAA